MVDATSLVLLKKAGNGTLLTEGVKQLKLSVGKVHKYCGHPVLWQGLHQGNDREIFVG